MIRSGACAKYTSTLGINPYSLNRGSIYCLIVPGAIVDSITMMAPFLQRSRTEQTAAITKDGSMR